MTDSSKPTENQIDGETKAEAEDQAAKTQESLDQIEDEATIEEESETKAQEDIEQIEEVLQDADTPLEAPEPEITSEPKRSGGFMGPVVGGIIAAVIGFGASQYLGPLGLFGDPQNDTRIDELVLKNDEVAQTIADLKASVAAIAPVDMTPQITALGDTAEDLAIQIETLSQALTDLDVRVTEIEKAPIASGDSSGAAAAYQRELEEMRAELADQRARNDELLTKVETAASDATSEARALEAHSAAMRIMAALETGTGFEAALGSLSGYDLPAALTDVAQTGVTSLAGLQTEFAGYARDALAASLKAAPGASTSERLSNFLRVQTGARSLTPRDGDDPDAVLSRAQAAVAAGDLTTALAELTTLPENGQAAMADWVAQAQARLDAQAAAKALLASVN
ncbi:COG4223 family protein [Actibacterium atlanticum]|uniref:COG4223 family protein n=1 Tax=Actibacterium atlanticum TaxID=1461693 RepID=UPI0012DC00EA|nr:mitofilin family membrane protein [Actibacterium atlanticum]